MSDKIDPKYMDIGEFRDLGYLQEVNRLFFHPLGLALSVAAGEDGGNAVLHGIWDERDDPEGLMFYDGDIDPEKVQFVKAEFEKRMGFREKLLAPGRNFQMPDDKVDDAVSEDDAR
jgi:hypothetical protein